MKRSAVLLVSLVLALVPAVAGSDDWKLREEGVDLSEGAYDAKLSAETVEFREPNGESYGPVALRLLSTAEYDRFVEMAAAAEIELDEDDFRELTVEVKVIHLQNLNLSRELVSVTVDTVRTAEGPVTLPPGWVDGMTAHPTLLEVGPRPHLHGSATIDLPNGLRAPDVVGVEGTLTLRLPLELARLEFDPREPAARQSASGLELVLFEGTADSVTLEYTGPFDPFLRIAGFDAKGETVPRRHYWITGRGDGAAAREMLASAESNDQRGLAQALLQKRVFTSFTAPIARVEALVAGGFAERSYRFKISR
jgi:hypothetical protein